MPIKEVFKNNMHHTIICEQADFWLIINFLEESPHI